MEAPEAEEAEMSKEHDNREALAAFVARKAGIDTMLGRLKVLSEDHFNLAPDEIDWGHVGTLEMYERLLRRLSDAAFREGEHAA
jgi:hypothetical protein